MLWILFISAGQSHAQSTIIYQDDFEGAVSDWSVVDTDFAPAVTTFLGRFADTNTTTFRTFAVPSNTEELVIEFDLYRFDSWDNSTMFGLDRFELDIDGTEIFSLPFPNPQGTRSGQLGNVDWSHSPLTGREELGFNSGEFWFDQVHRFVITVENPGTMVELTLRANLSQIEPDESAGYDNFLVTAFTDGNFIQAVPETFAAIDGDIGGSTPSVLASDTINGIVLNPADVTITSTSSGSPNVTLNAATGIISVAANTPAGPYTVDYEICEVIDSANCSSVTETLEVFTVSSPLSMCPIGTISVPGTYHVVSASGGTNTNQALGAPLNNGASVGDNNTAYTYFPTITLDLTGDPDVLVPEGEVIQMALSQAHSQNARGEILMSLDGTTYTSLGTSGFQGSVYGAWTANVLRYDAFEVPAGGARFIQISQEAGGVRSDGVIYGNQCQIPSGIILAVAEDFAAVDGDAGGVTPSVLSSDTISGVILDPAEVTLTFISSSNPNISLDSTTGFITVAPNTAVGTYMVDYQICEIANPANCSSVTEILDVFTSEGFPSTCPVGTSEIPGTYHVVSASGGTNTNQALGAPLNNGASVGDNNTAYTYFPTITLDLTGDPDVLVPEGEVIQMALSQAHSQNARGEILMSLDGTTYTSLGTSGFQGSVYGAWTANVLRYDAFEVPAGGARFIQISQEAGGVRSDGVIYGNQCQIPAAAPTNVTASKTVAVHDPQGLGLYAIPGNDVIYSFNIENSGAGDVDSGSLVLIDSMPPEIAFYNGDIDDAGPETDPVSFEDSGGSLTFDFNTDVGFSNASAPPADFASCTYTPINGYDEDVTYICFNPKGVMVGQSNWSVSFRSRIL